MNRNDTMSLSERARPNEQVEDYSEESLGTMVRNKQQQSNRYNQHPHQTNVNSSNAEIQRTDYNHGLTQSSSSSRTNVMRPSSITREDQNGKNRQATIQAGNSNQQQFQPPPSLLSLKTKPPSLFPIMQNDSK